MDFDWCEERVSILAVIPRKLSRKSAYSIFIKVIASDEWPMEMILLCSFDKLYTIILIFLSGAMASEFNIFK